MAILTKFPSRIVRQIASLILSHFPGRMYDVRRLFILAEQKMCAAVLRPRHRWKITAKLILINIGEYDID